jgi:excisionase family DNA binding protein
MEQARIGKTASRRILGSMNDFTGMMRSHPWPPPDSNRRPSAWEAIALRVRRVPIRPQPTHPSLAIALRRCCERRRHPGAPRRRLGAQGSLLSVRAVAARLGVSTATVYKVVAEGTLLHVRVANAIRIAPADVDAQGACQGFGTATRQQYRPD